MQVLIGTYQKLLSNKDFVLVAEPLALWPWKYFWLW